jgi:glucokinase
VQCTTPEIGFELDSIVEKTEPHESDLVMAERTCLAIDIGGTKMAAGVVDGRGTLRSRRQIGTLRTGGPEELFSALVGLCEGVLEDGGEAPSVAGVGCGGPMESEGVTVSPLNIPQWREFPLAERLASSLSLDVVIDNDAKALALGEGWKGSAQGVSSYMAMVVSTGIGGGIVLNGTLLDGRSGNAGHVGHVIVEPNGRLCACGMRGCLEAEASGTAIEAIIGAPAASASQEVVERTGQLVGRAVATVAILLDLELCCVAGSVALGFGRPFFEAAQKELDRNVGLAYAKNARIIPAGLGDEGPLIGAAAVGFAGIESPEFVR